MKVCGKCGIYKPFTKFYKDKTKSDGHRSYCKECGKKYSISWNKTNSSKRRRITAKYRNSHTKYLKESYRKWEIENPDKVRAKVERRRALLNCVEINDFTGEQWSQMKEQYSYTCVYCRGFFGDKITMDHVVPLSKGGNHTQSNIVPACHSCNASKGNKSLEDWPGNSKSRVLRDYYDPKKFLTEKI